MIFCNKRQTKTIVKMFRDKVLSRFDVIKCNGKIVVEGIAFGAHEGWERTAANSEHPPFGVSQRVANKGLNGEGSRLPWLQGQVAKRNRMMPSSLVVKVYIKALNGGITPVHNAEP